MKNLLLIVLFLLINLPFYGQVNHRSETGKITGKIVDKITNNPIEYASIILYTQKDSLLVRGTITNRKGKFVLDTLPFGKYFLEYSFIGFQKDIINNININTNNENIDLGTITLKSSIENLKEVSVKAEKNRMEFKIDKQVINVDKDMSAAGGTAVDVLKNSPSIKIDKEENISLRGSKSFTLLIDGKPTVINLKLIPASTIDKIEIITNPSAKYSPDGVAGIINIITKKDMKNGIGGSVNASVGTFNKYNVDANLNYTTKKIRIISNLGYINKYKYFTDSENRQTFMADTTITETDYNISNQILDTKLKLGMDYLANEKTTFSFFVKYDKRERNSKNTSDAYQHAINYYYTNNYNEIFSGDYYVSNFNFDHKFSKKNEKITANSFFLYFNNNTLNSLMIDTTNSDFETMGFLPGKTKKNENNNYFRNRTRIDYTKPIGSKGLLETGYNYDFVEDNSLNEYNTSNYNLDSMTNFLLDTNNLFIYSKSIHSLYGTYSNTFKDIDYKIGLRIEYYTRITNQKSINEKYILKQFNYFPTLHLQYKISKKHTLQCSYSKRINRFWGTQLNPFPIYLDVNNFSKGNPKLQPEYIDSYDFSYLYYFKSSYLSTGLYYRQTNNLLGEIQILQNDGILLHTYENLNRDFTTGLELMLNLIPIKWWHFNTSFNYYQYQIKGIINNDDINRQTNSYDLRVENTFRLKHAFKIQLTGYYSGPTISTQEDIDAFYTIGIAIKKGFFKQNLNFSLRMDDIFNTGIYYSIRKGNNYLIQYESHPKYPIIYFQITYKF